MREIKFRGYGKDEKHWIYGSLLDERSVGIVAIQDEDCHVWEVDPCTVGQFTGLRDADGQEIYEGDILEVDYPFYWPAPPLPRERVVVCYFNGKFQFHLASPHSYTDLCFAKLAKVIGNVHDNPQLLERKS